MQIRFPAVAVIGIVLLLTGCQGPPMPEPGNECVPTEPGPISDAITVSGGQGDTPSVRLPAEVEPNRVERTVIRNGEGRVADDGALVTFAYVAVNGATGELLDQVGYGSPYIQATADDASLVPGLQEAIMCAPEGSRITAVAPSVDAVAGAENQQFRLATGDPVVFIVDVAAVASDRADGVAQPMVDGLPLVEVGATGEPQVTMPASAAPAAGSTTVLKKGSGEEVAEGATVTIEYRGVVWGSGRTFDSSWQREELVQLPTTSFIPGVAAALAGQTVGSQVMAIVPASQGYGEAGNAKLGISATDTIVFVIDILAVVQPPTTAGQG